MATSYTTNDCRRCRRRDT